MASNADNYAALTCKHCNAHLRVAAASPTVTCEYCGATYRTSDLIDIPAPPDEPADPYNGLGEPARGRDVSSDARRARSIRVIVALIFLSVAAQIFASFVADDSSSASSVSSTSTVISSEPLPPASSSSSASSSGSTNSDAFGGSGSSSSTPESSGGSSVSSSAPNVAIEPTKHRNPDAVTPELKQQVDDLEADLLDCLQKLSAGDKTMEPYLNMLLSLDQFDDIDDSNLSAADRAYLSETLSHTVSLFTQVMGSGFKLNLSGKAQSFL